MNKLFTLYCILPSLFISCIKPLDVDTGKEQLVLVVEGYISTLPGPYNIQITQSAKYGNIFEGVIRWQKGAEVWIRDSDGMIIDLHEIRTGVYQTPAQFRGELWKSYTLNIVTAIGERYVSLPQTITPVPDIDSIYSVYTTLPYIDPWDSISGMEIRVQWEDPADQDNYYMWRNNGADFGIYIDNDINTNGEMNTQPVTFIEDDGEIFDQGIAISIRQMSLSREAYQFFDLLKQLKSINGDIFDPPPATQRGNFINIDDPKKSIIGYFLTSDAVEKTVVLKRTRK